MFLQTANTRRSRREVRPRAMMRGGRGVGRGMAMTTVNFKNLSTSALDEDALTTALAGDKLLNFGDLTTTGDLANGIFAGADNVTVKNLGHVETSGLGAAGLYAQGQNVRIENYGSV